MGRGGNARLSFLARLMIKLGLARTPRGAQLALSAVLLVLLAVTYFIVMGASTPLVNTSDVPNDFQPGQSAFRR